MPEAIDLSRPHTLYLPDEAATTALGTRIAPLLNAGDVIYLQGELGMGKSSLVRSSLLIPATVYVLEFSVSSISFLT